MTEPLPSRPQLRSYQSLGAAFLAERSAALLADEMGLGKTVQAIAALRSLRDTGRVSRALVVCPSSLRLNWAREFERWAPDLAARRVLGDREDRAAHYRLPVPVLIASYDQIRADFAAFRGTRPLDLMILDEAQRIKNSSTETSFACRVVAKDRAWALTGTPVENRVEDLLSIYRFLAPGLLHVGMDRATIHERIGNTMLRRRKKDVMSELPPIIVQDLELELTAAQRAAYDALWHTSRNSLRDLSNTGVLAAITRLKQLCNSDAATGESAKLEALQTVLESAEGDGQKVLVFSQYVETLTWLSEHISLPTDLLHGGQSETTRDEILQRFSAYAGPRVLLASLKAAGVGLNINAAHLVVLFDRWWNPAVEDQAIARAHRLGRETPLHVVRFLTRDTIEESIGRLLEQKRELFANIVEDAPQATLTGRELLSLLQVEPSAQRGPEWQGSPK